jgi:hypothetical protein
LHRLDQRVDLFLFQRVTLAQQAFDCFFCHLKVFEVVGCVIAVPGELAVELLAGHLAV